MNFDITEIKKDDVRIIISSLLNDGEAELADVIKVYLKYEKVLESSLCIRNENNQI